MPSLHTLQLSQIPRRRGGMPQAMKVLIAGILAWFFVAFVVWLIGLAV